MPNQTIEDPRVAIVGRLGSLQAEINSCPSPRQEYDAKRDLIQKNLDDLFESGDAKANRQEIGKCYYDLKTLEDDFAANADELEADFQQRTEEMTVDLLNEIHQLVGSRITERALKKRDDGITRYEHFSSPERLGSATSHSHSTKSRSLDAASVASSGAVSGHVVDSVHDYHEYESFSHEESLTPRREFTGARQASKLKPPFNSRQTVTFSDVYDEGNAIYKHVIVEHPKASNKWYIMVCEKHDMCFNTGNAILGACRHLLGKSHDISANHDEVVRLLGIRVTGCSQELADRNNKSVKEFVDSTTHPRKPNLNKRSLTDGFDSEGEEAELINDANAVDKIKRQRVHRSDEAIADPIVGPVYSVYWTGDRRWYGGVVLSIKERLQPDMLTLYDTGLLDDQRPDCYMYDAQSRICAWSPGYEDGGALVLDRLFPILFFDRDKFPVNCQSAWIPSRDIRLFRYTKDLPYRRSIEEYIKPRQNSHPAKLDVNFASQVTQIQSETLPGQIFHTQPETAPIEELRPRSEPEASKPRPVERVETAPPRLQFESRTGEVGAAAPSQPTPHDRPRKTASEQPPTPELNDLKVPAVQPKESTKYSFMPPVAYMGGLGETSGTRPDSRVDSMPPLSRSDSLPTPAKKDTTLLNPARPGFDQRLPLNTHAHVSATEPVAAYKPIPIPRVVSYQPGHPLSATTNPSGNPRQSPQQSPRVTSPSKVAHASGERRPGSGSTFTPHNGVRKMSS
jgi:hypothetical protein